MSNINNAFTFDPSSVNDINNNNNFGFFNPEENINNENIEVNYPKLDEINNQSNNNNTGFSFNFVPEENNNFKNIEGFQPSPSGFDYEAFNNSKKKEPATNNDKLDNALKNLF